MLTVQQGFLVVTKVFTMANDQLLAVILSTAFWLINITNFYVNRTFRSTEIYIEKKAFPSQLHHLCNLFVEWRLFIHAEQMSLYNFIISRKKRDSNTCVFLWNLCNFQEQ